MLNAHNYWQKERVGVNTKLIKVDPQQPDTRLLQEAATALRNGSLVAFPTETVYGLGANALSAESVLAIFRTKGRPNDNPLIVHVASWEQIENLVEEISEQACFLMQRFMPGPFTAVLFKKSCIPNEVSAGLSTVGVRIPENPVAREFLRLAACPVAAPSANLSGKPSPTTAADCWEDLADKIPYIIDGGSCSVGVESTVVDLTGTQPRILRPGAVTAEMIRTALRDFDDIRKTSETDSVNPAAAEIMLAYHQKLNQGETPAAPGMKYRHYAPKAPVYLLPHFENPAFVQRLQNLKAQLKDFIAAGRHLRIGLFTSAKLGQKWQKYLSVEDEQVENLEWCVQFFAEGDEATEDYIQLATHHLFAALRHFDRQHVDFILAEQIQTEGVGEAYMNRISKAAQAELELAPNPTFEVDLELEEEMSSSSDRSLRAEKDVEGCSILFVCTGNTCRSPMAEYLLRDLLRRRGLAGHYLVQSAGTDAFPGEAAADLAIEALAERDIDLRPHRSQALSYDLLEDSDLILTMSERHKAWIQFMYPQSEKKVHTLPEFVAAKTGGIADPYGQSLVVYQQTAEELYTLLQVLPERLNGLKKDE